MRSNLKSRLTIHTEQDLSISELWQGTQAGVVNEMISDKKLFEVVQLWCRSATGEEGEHRRSHVEYYTTILYSVHIKTRHSVA